MTAKESSINHSCDTFDEATAAHRDGDLKRARALYLATVEAEPGHSAACNNLGLIEASAERMPEAREWFQRALDADPMSLDAATNLIQSCLALQDVAAASDLLASALEGHDAEGLSTLIERGERLAAESLERRDFEAAWQLSRQLQRAAGGDIALGVLARCLRHIDPRSAPEDIRDDHLACFAASSLDHRILARSAVLCLEVAYRWIRQPPEQDLIETAVDTGFADDELLHALLTQSINVNPVFEELLRALRREYLQSFTDDVDPGSQSNRLLTSLAIQAFSNEYVWSTDDDEEQALRALVARLEQTPTGDVDDRTVRSLCVAASYRSAMDLARDGLGELLAAARTPWAVELITRLLDDPRAEAALAATLTGATIDDAVSRAVQAQYERSPYPRWLTLEPEPPDSVSGHLSHLFPGLRPPAFLANPVEILIAGCGTGEHALRVALRHPECSIHALDLSRASLAYAMRKAGELGIDNVQFIHDDLLRIGGSARRYPVIESVGVLHHMRDPQAGLAALTQVLMPGGVIKLGLYSRAGRRDVRSAWQRIRALGLTRSDDRDLRAFRRRVLDGEEPDLKAIARSDDFYTLSNVRDLLFHVQEHQFTLPEIQALLNAVGLMLIGFQPTDSVRRRYVARYDNDPWLQSMENLNRYEREHPLAFAGMYQFWCFKPPA